MKTSSGLKILIYIIIIPLILGAGFAGGVIADHFLIAPAIASASGSPQPTGDLGLVNEAYGVIQQNYVDRTAVQQTPLEYGAISGMVDALGDTGHSRFLSPQMVQEENNYTSGSFEGIGAEVMEKNGNVVIVAPIDGSPAQKAGVKPGDIILKVDGNDVTGLTLQQVVNKVLGPAGTKVTLTLQNPTTQAIRDVTITRAKIVVQNVTWTMIPGTKIAHLRIAAFSQGVTNDLRLALNEIQAQGATGIVLDLRNDPGGLLDEAVGVTSQFVGTGNALLVKNAQGQEQGIPVKSGGLALNIPLVVLINQGTGSASEIVAGALQDAKRGTLVGETTFGTGTVLNQFQLSDGSELLLATEEWLTPNGRVIWHKGIDPDQKVTLSTNVDPVVPEAEKSMTADQLKSSQDTQLLKAIQLLSSGG